MSRRCFKCMKEIDEHTFLCPHCGFDNEHIDGPEYAMKPGTILHEQYLIGTVLGQGGFGITYVGYDISLELKVCIKEYYPMGQVSRSSEISNTVNWNRTQITQEQWENSCRNFIKEAQRVERIFTLPGVVRIRNTFFENDSAYIVMDYIDGITLKDKLKQSGPMTFEECRKLFVPLMKSLEDLHRQNVIHRDISPDNIMVAEDGRLWLLDLDASKAIEDLQEGMSKLVMKKGFSPPEQYSTGVEIGPWTDVYALTATMYYCITGKLMPDALDRMMKSREIPFDNGYGKELTPEMRDIFERGMDVRSESRIQTVSELREKLDTVGIKKKKAFWKSKKFKLGVLVAVVGGIIVMNSFLNIMINIKISGRQEQSQKKNVLMKPDKTLMVINEDEENYEYKVFHSEYDKIDILSITFVDNLDDMQKNAWDVSEDGDGSVMAWVVPHEDEDSIDGNLYDLYIGADGQIIANKDCGELFADYDSVKKIDFNECFNTEIVEDMHSMFSGCFVLQEMDISNFNTENAKDMSYMFNNCMALDKIDVTGFDTDKVENMRGMFNGCSSFRELNVDMFDTRNVKNMSSMFRECSALTDLNLENFDTSKVKSMQSMFRECTELINLDISNFNTEQVTNMGNMFYECKKLENVDTSKIIMDQVINSDYIYGGCYKLKDKVDYNVYELKDDEVSTVIECKYANMYSMQDTSSDVIAQIPVGTQVKIIYNSVNDRFSQYRKVTYNDQTGYIESYYLMEDD